MSVTEFEVVSILSAVIAVLMLGSKNLPLQVSLFSAQIWLISGETAWFAYKYQHFEFYIVALTLLTQRAVIVPRFLDWLVKRIEISYDPGMILPAPLTMHFSILLFALSFFVGQHLPSPDPAHNVVIATATASISHLFSGIIMMLTRRLAISQIMGFLNIENGVYLFAFTQTNGLPLLIEMAVFVDILGAVMIGGVLVFSIKRSFEHIDVSQLTDLKH